MATKLILKSKTTHESGDYTKAYTESYSEKDGIGFYMSEFVRFLKADGWSVELIQKYLNTDGEEVWELGE